MLKKHRADLSIHFENLFHTYYVSSKQYTYLLNATQDEANTSIR